MPRGPLKPLKPTLKKDSEGVTMEVQPNGSKLMRAPKGVSINPNGRPRKIVYDMKEMGYSLCQVNDTFLALLAMTPDEIQLIADNPNSNVLESTVARALINSHKKGSLFNLETVLTRALGKPKEQVDSTVTNVNPQIIIQPVTSNVPLANSNDE